MEERAGREDEEGGGGGGDEGGSVDEDDDGGDSSDTFPGLIQNARLFPLLSCNHREQCYPLILAFQIKSTVIMYTLN